jgi:hypothetical protein
MSDGATMIRQANDGRNIAAKVAHWCVAKLAAPFRQLACLIATGNRAR